MRTDARDARGALETRPGQRLHSSHRIALREIINRLRGERVSPRETRNSIMTIQELIDALETMAPDGDAFVVLFKADGTSAQFDIDDVVDFDGNAQLEINEG